MIAALYLTSFLAFIGKDSYLCGVKSKTQYLWEFQPYTLVIDKALFQANLCALDWYCDQDVQWLQVVVGWDNVAMATQVAAQRVIVLLDWHARFHSWPGHSLFNSRLFFVSKELSSCSCVLCKHITLRHWSLDQINEPTSCLTNLVP